jgi:hypothetical protein
MTVVCLCGPIYVIKSTQSELLSLWLIYTARDDKQLYISGPGLMITDYAFMAPGPTDERNRILEIIKWI